MAGILPRMVNVCMDCKRGGCANTADAWNERTTFIQHNTHADCVIGLVLRSPSYYGLDFLNEG